MKIIKIMVISGYVEGCRVNSLEITRFSRINRFKNIRVIRFTTVTRVNSTDHIHSSQVIETKFTSSDHIHSSQLGVIRANSNDHIHSSQLGGNSHELKNTIKPL